MMRPLNDNQVLERKLTIIILICVCKLYFDINRFLYKAAVYAAQFYSGFILIYTLAVSLVSVRILSDKTFNNTP